MVDSLIDFHTKLMSLHADALRKKRASEAEDPDGGRATYDRGFYHAVNHILTTFNFVDVVQLGYIEAATPENLEGPFWKGRDDPCGGRKCDECEIGGCDGPPIADPLYDAQLDKENFERHENKPGDDSPKGDEADGGLDPESLAEEADHLMYGRD